MTLEADPTEIAVPVEFTVHDLELPHPLSLKFCTWSYVTHHFEGMEKEVNEDLIEHANTVFLGKAPKAKFDAEGNLVESIDYTEHDEFIRAYAPHGFILFSSPQNAARGPKFSIGWMAARL